MDTSSDRDFAVSFLHAASLAMVHLSRLAEDVIYFTAEEFGFFELADSSATGSSMMPQKKNPDPMELVRGKAGRVIGHQVALLVAMKGLPTGYNKDLQEDKEGVFDAEDTLAVSLDATASVVSKLTLRPERTGKAASGLLLATDAADYLVRRGLPFRDAHEVIGKMVRELLAAGRDFDDLSLAEWRAYSDRSSATTCARRSAPWPRCGRGARRSPPIPTRCAPPSTRRAAGWRRRTDRGAWPAAR